MDEIFSALTEASNDDMGGIGNLHRENSTVSLTFVALVLSI